MSARSKRWRTLPPLARSVSVSCKIFEPLGFTNRIQQHWVYKTRIDSIQRWCHSGAKTKPIHLDSSAPLITGSGILDPDQLSFCTIYTSQLEEIHHLETWGLVICEWVMNELDTSCERDGHELFLVFLVPVNELGMSCERDRHELCGTTVFL